jgi:hypothetical protein
MCCVEIGEDAVTSSTNHFKTFDSNLCWFSVNVDILNVTDAGSGRLLQEGPVVCFCRIYMIYFARKLRKI